MERHPVFIPVLVRLNVEYRPIHRIFRVLSGIVDRNSRKAIRESLRADDLYGAFSLVGDYLETADRYLVLMFDEFQQLPSLVKSDGYLKNVREDYIFEFFRGLTEEFRINLVVAGSLIGPLMDAIDVWHGRFKLFRLREFPREDSILMLKKLFELSGFEISEDVAEYIAVAMNDHPFHMQLFGYNLVKAGKINEETIEKTRKLVQKELIGYYQAKLLEARQMNQSVASFLFKALDGLNMETLSNDELQTALKLERAGILYREDTIYTIYDKMFERYLETLKTQRPKEKYIPEFSSEYLVAKNIAYKEGLRNVLVSLMSWGPFDIVILEKIGDYSGIGIQVKRSYEKPKMLQETIETLKSEAKKFNLLPLVAWVKFPEKEICYIDVKAQTPHKTLMDIIKSYGYTNKTENT